jgi:hypothetical protein
MKARALGRFKENKNIFALRYDQAFIVFLKKKSVIIGVYTKIYEKYE